MNLKERATGLTLLWVVALSLALSLLPLPEALRPFPGLASEPRTTLAELLLPPSRSAPESAGSSVAEAALEAAMEAELAPADLAHVEARTGAHGLAEALGGLGRGPMHTRALKLEALGEQLGVKHLEVEAGCRTRDAQGACTEEALAPFFTALEGLHTGARTRPVRALHLGDSLIASDHITDLIRDRLQARHGDGGTGFLFVDRPTRGSGRTVRTGKASTGWNIEKITDRTWPEGVLGLSGVLYSTQGATSERTELPTRGAQSAELWFRTQARGGTLEVSAAGKSVGRILTDFTESDPGYARLQLPEGAERITVTSSGGPVQLYGVSLERESPGVVYDSIGLPGATAKVLLRPDPQTFDAQLKHRDPALIVLMLGGNEAFEMSRKRTTPEEARESFTQLVRRLRAAQPGAACLMTGTLDAGVRTLSKDIIPRLGSREISDVIREVAAAEGCAYWDMLEAMGGVGVTRMWLEKGLMLEDLVHPRALGADLIGHLFDVALERAFLRWQGPRRAHDLPGLEGAAPALDPLGSKLGALKRQERDRVAVVQLGASHTAGHAFTDVVRSRLAETYGSRGRGYVAAGIPSERLEPKEVQRELAGTWKVLDAWSAGEQARGLAWGLNGVRAVGDAGARSRWRFCDGCSDTEVKTTLSLHYLRAPGMGRLEVRVDGNPVEVPIPAEVQEEALEPRAEIATWEVTGAAHTLEVINLGPGPLTIFGASSEQQRPGIVYDALGLPGATVFNVADFDQTALRTQLASRAPDLVVLNYGTNESDLSQLDVPAMRKAYATLFETFRAAAPDAACLLIGPTDRMRAGEDGGWTSAPSQDRVIAALRQLAQTEGCAFWSARAAMGGPGAIQRWQRPGLAHPDHVHLTPTGYARLANAFADDLLAALTEGR